ncbi:ABC transporter ATP-binding protein [Terrisporobacter glycolicus]|uniref:Vitamin B12 import ATP-binding protein BtuD n=1 Tax=Terrisporobacter glycolicus ATCC 14880 = DSM 1288 TaxID=1121315 RepID=A0ABZ2EV83_9FIRM|nr:ABC transporter ATP-binding protein [Terrisporobacter glycolicus]
MNVLKVEKLKKTFIKDKKEFVAVNNFDLEIKERQCVGLVGESGCGKSTVAKIITNLEKSSEGNIFINNLNIKEFNSRNEKELYKQIQMIFQDPMDSFNPRIKLGNSIGEIKINFGYNKKEVKKEVIDLLEQVGLSKDYYYRYPKEVSGGECQRAAIARALLIKPKLLVCDEATSALDVSIQGQIINLLTYLQKKTNISFLFISHDLALVQNFCDKIYVMYEGEIVETGSRDQIINNANHPYTKLLLYSNFAIFEDDKYYMEEFDEMDMETDKTFNGCKFYERCPFRLELCKDNTPRLKNLQEEHFAACHIV